MNEAYRLLVQLREECNFSSTRRHRQIFRQVFVANSHRLRGTLGPGWQEGLNRLREDECEDERVRVRDETRVCAAEKVQRAYAQARRDTYGEDADATSLVIGRVSDEGALYDALRHEGLLTDEPDERQRFLDTLRAGGEALSEAQLRALVRARSNWNVSSAANARAIRAAARYHGARLIGAHGQISCDVLVAMILEQQAETIEIVVREIVHRQFEEEEAENRSVMESRKAAAEAAAADAAAPEVDDPLRAAAAGEMMEVACPAELTPDRTIRIALPDEREFDVVVPASVTAGEVFLVGPFPGKKKKKKKKKKKDFVAVRRRRRTRKS